MDEDEQALALKMTPLLYIRSWVKISPREGLTDLPLQAPHHLVHRTEFHAIPHDQKDQKGETTAFKGGALSLVLGREGSGLANKWSVLGYIGAPSLRTHLSHSLPVSLCLSLWALS